MTEKHKVVIIGLVAIIVILITFVSTLGGLLVELSEIEHKASKLIIDNNRCDANLFSAEKREQNCENARKMYEDMYFECIDEKMDMVYYEGVNE